MTVEGMADHLSADGDSALQGLESDVAPDLLISGSPGSLQGTAALT